MFGKKPIPLNFDFIQKIDLTKKKEGFVALLFGIVVALILGILAQVFAWGNTWIWFVLILGVAIGILNIFHEEGILFVLTLLTLTFMLNLLVGLAIFPIWTVILFNAVIYLIAPVAVIVSLKVLYALSVN